MEIVLEAREANVVAKATRRRLTAEYKRRALQEAERAIKRFLFCNSRWRPTSSLPWILLRITLDLCLFFRSPAFARADRAAVSRLPGLRLES